MERLFNWEQWRIITISTVSPLFGYLTPTKVFVVREYLKKIFYQNMQSLTRCGTIRTTKKTDGKVFLFHSTRHENLFDNNLCMLCFCSICDIL